MISYINTAEVDSISEELLSAANDLETEFNALFARFANVPNVTKEWVGNQANFYFSKVASDKQQYTALVNELRKLGQELAHHAANAQNRIKGNNN